MALTVTINAKDRLSGVLGSIGKGIKGVAFGFNNLDRIMRSVLVGTSIKLASDMDKGLREVGTLMGGLTDGEMKDMGAELEHIASATGSAMDKLTKAKYDIVSAGFNKAGNSAKVLAAAADLAVGGVTEVSTAADLLTTTLNSYNRTADDAVDVSDKLFTVVRLGKTTMNELGGSMGRVLAIAGEAGVSLDEVGASLAVLTARGQNTAEASTAIRAAIVSIFKPTTDLQKVIEELGFATGKSMLDQIGMAESLKLITKEAEKQKLPMEKLFTNVRAMQSVLPLTGKAADDFQKALIEMGKSSGATATAVAEMRKAFETDMKKLKQNVNNILRTIGDALIKIIQPKIKVLNDALQTLGDIGWENVAKTMIDNWDKAFETMGQLAKVFFDAIVPLAKTAFSMAGKTAIKALKLAFAVADFSITDLLFGGDERRNMAKLVQSFGEDATRNFIDSVEAGKADISLLDPEATQQDILRAVADIDKSFVNSLGNIEKTISTAIKFDTLEHEVRSAGERLGESFGSSIGDTFDHFMTTGFDDESLGANLKSSTDQAKTIVADYMAWLVENSKLTAIEQGEFPPPDFKPTTDAFNAMKASGHNMFTSLKNSGKDFVLDNTAATQNMWNQLSSANQNYQFSLTAAEEQQLSEYQTLVNTTLESIKGKYALTAEDLSNIWKSWGSAQKEMDSLSMESRFLNLEMEKEQFKLAAIDKLTDAQELADALVQIELWASEQKRNIWKDEFTKYGQIANKAMGMLRNIYSIDISNSKRAQEKKIADIQERIDSGVLSETDGQEQIDQVNIDAQAEQKKLKRKQQHMDAISATISGVEAVMDTFAAFGGWPWGLIPAGIMAGIAAANVSAIKSQSFAFGGRVNPVPGGDTVQANLNPREMISTPAASEQFGDEITRMNQLAEGSGGGASFPEQITIHAVDSESLEESLKRNPVAIRNAIQEIKEDGFLTGVIE